MKNPMLLISVSVLLLLVGCKSNDISQIKNQTESTPEVESVRNKSTTLSGSVTFVDGTPSIGANIVIKGTSDGTVTDIDGTFFMKTVQSLPFDIVVSFTGYEPQELKITSEGEVLKIQLNEVAEILEEVVVDHSPSSTTKSGSIRVVGAAEMSRAPAAEMRSKRDASSSATVGTIKVPGDIDPNPKAGQITAAEWNDLYNWEDWTKLLSNQDYNEMQSHWEIYPRSRYSVFVRNKYELPLQDVKVELLDKVGKVLWTARTDNAGRVELWADINSREKSFEQVNARVVVNKETHLIDDLKSIEEGVNHLDVETECRTSPNVDIFFAVDATGSMGDEIRFLQSELKDVINRSLSSNSSLKVRMGSVFYRDSSDAYLTQVEPLNDEPLETLSFIGKQSASGGGDYPEAVDAALEEALAQDWSESAVARIIFLLLDAPPHHNPTVIKRLQEQITDAAKEGIKIIPITASGINRQTEFLMKFMALSTNGTYVFITDHSGIGNPHLDPVVQDFEVEKLNDLLVRLLYNYTKSNGCNANEPINNGIAFYPNPARSFVNITTDRPIKTLRVLSNTGMLVQTKTDVKKGETKIDLTGLIDGVYTVHCKGDDIDHSQSVVVVNR